MLDAMRLLFDRIPDEYRLLMEPRLDELTEAIEPGITTLNWLSVDIPEFVQGVYKVIDKLQLLIDRCASYHTRTILTRKRYCLASHRNIRVLVQYKAALCLAVGRTTCASSASTWCCRRCRT